MKANNGQQVLSSFYRHILPVKRISQKFNGQNPANTIYLPALLTCGM
jgi:hypothetical protein